MGAGDATRAFLSRDERHQQALDVIRRRESGGRPFALYLRDFMGGARSLHAQYHERQQFTIDNQLLGQLSPDVGLVFIQSEAEEQAWANRPGDPLGPQGPSLRLTHDTWKPYAERLISLADIIFVDAPKLSEGTRFELTACLAKPHQTVVILTPPNFMRWRQDEKHQQEDDADELVQRFPRVVWSDDLYKDVAGNPVLKDLIARALAMARSGVREAEPPITYAGVLDHYLQSSAVRSAARQPWHEDPWEDNWERTFWGFHRAALTALSMFDLRAADQRHCLSVLVECYRSMANLLGESLVIDRGLVMRGHIDLIGMLAFLALRAATQAGDPATVEICQDMVLEADKRSKLIKTKAMPYAPILKSLFFLEFGRTVTCAPEDAAQF